MTRRVLLVEIGTPAGLPVVTPPAPRPPSTWAPELPAPAVLPPPSGLTATRVADGALLEWVPSPAEGARSIVEAAVDNDGTPGTWREVRRVESGLYMLSISEGKQWARIRAELNGRMSAPTSPVLCSPLSVSDAIEDIGDLEQSVEDVLAEQVALQAKIDQEIADRIAEDLRIAGEAAADATAKANAALAEAMAAVSSLEAQVADIIGAPDWDVSETYEPGQMVKFDGGLYRALVQTTGDQPDTSPAEWEKVGDYDSLGEAVAAALTLATQTASELEAEVTRINALYARMPAGTDGLATEAMVLAEAQALASDISAEASRIDGLVARMPTGDGLLATQASVNTVDQARIDGDAALASSITAVETLAQGAQSTAGTALTAANNAASAATTAQTTADNAQSTATNALAATATNATAISAVALDLGDTQASVSALSEVVGSGISGNALVNGGFEGTIAPWSTTWVGNTPGLPSGWSRYTTAGSGIRTGAGALRINNEGTIYNLHRIKVTEGQPVRVGFWSRMIGTAPTNGSYLEVVIRNWDVDGTHLGFDLAPAQRQSEGAVVYGYTLTEGIYTPRPGAVEITFGLRTRNHVSGSWIVDDLFAEPLSNTDQTMMARHTVALNVNGYVSGTVNENDGETSSFSILSDVFRVLSPGAAEGMEWRDGYLRVYGSGYQRILGTNFGVSSHNLVDYFGPNVGAANASKSNATMWMDKSGNAYWGGNLSAGVLKNAAQSTQVSNRATVETGRFGTNGNQKVVTYSLSYFNTGMTTSSDQRPSAGNTSANVVLERRRNGTGSWSQVSSMTASGAIVHEPEPGGVIVMVSLGGSSTFTDNSTGTQDFEYRARITSHTGSWPWTNPMGSPGQQSLAIISIEE